MKPRLPKLALAALLFCGCGKTETHIYTLRSYGTWNLGEARTCLFAKGIDSAPCFSPEQVQNGTQEPQHGYLVSVTFDRAIPFAESGVYGVVCRLESSSNAWCHVADKAVRTEIAH
jgi:hypothetical protein